jgi:hypothetical protein
MGYIDKLLSQQEVPLIRNFWLRFVKYLMLAIIVSYGLYWVLSQMNSDTLKSLSNRRSGLFLLLLGIMPAKGWGWFFFIGIISSTLWGDWRNFRWQSFPKKKSNENGDNENNPNNGN